MTDEQQTIQAGTVTTDRVTYGSVWVLAADMMEGGHPQVLGVYDNEEAAKAHEKAIKKNGHCTKQNGYDHPVASFWLYEKPVETEFGGSP